MNIYRLTEEEYKRILMFKRDLHMHPELSRKEVRTRPKANAFIINTEARSFKRKPSSFYRTEPILSDVQWSTVCRQFATPVSRLAL